MEGILTTIDADTGSIATTNTSIDGKITACNTGAVVLSSGTVTTVSTVTNLSQMGGVAIALNTGARSAGTQRVTIATDDVVPASQSGTWNVTNVSGTVSLPTGASTEATLSTLNGKVTACNTGAVVVSSSALPSGASTAAKQPALGTAGTASADVISVQGIASMTALKVDGSAVTQPVSGTVTANPTAKTILSTGGSASSSGNNTLVAAGTNKLKVFAFSLSTTSTTAITCIFQSGASGTELWRCILQAGTSTSTGANLTVTPPAWLFATASATLLNLNLSSANAVHWSASYFDEA